MQIKECIQTEQACTVRILNYRLTADHFLHLCKDSFYFLNDTFVVACRKDRSSFWNLLHISPVRKASGKVIFVSINIFPLINWTPWIPFCYQLWLQVISFLGESLLQLTVICTILLLLFALLQINWSVQNILGPECHIIWIFDSLPDDQYE